MTPHPTPLRRTFLKGGALLVTISAMLVLGIMGASVVKLTSTSQSTHLSANATFRAHYLAESGLSHAQHTVSTEGWRHGRERTLNFQGGDEVSVIRIADYFWATSVVDAGTATEGRALVPALVSTLETDPDEPNNKSSGDFAIFGENSTAIGQDTLIDGDVAIIANEVDIRGDVEGSVFAGNVLVNGQGSVEIEIAGGIFSSGIVSVRSGTVRGDINAANGISINSAQAIVEGWIFSNGPIDIGSGAKVLGHVHANGGDVSIGGGSTIGTPDNPVEIRTSGNVYLSGSSTVYGTIYAGGEIIFSSSAAIAGDAIAGSSIAGGNISGKTLQDSPTFLEDPVNPNLSSLKGLELPTATEFVSGTQRVTIPRRVADSLAIYPVEEGSYRTLQAPNNSSGKNAGLLLSAGLLDDANYYFESINIDKDNQLYLNLSGNHDLRIFVEGNVDIATLDIYISTDGVNYVSVADPGVDPAAAARVYLEAHGDFDLASDGRFFGSVYTPYGNLNVGNTSLLYGSYYSGNGHNIIGTNLVHVTPNYYTEQEAAAGSLPFVEGP